jgi:dTDP-glucose pyrophosphorylase
MNVVIPMAGFGSRFAKAGYTVPKYLIEVNNKTLLQYSLSSLPLDICSNLIFICLKDHNINNKLRVVIEKILGHNKFIIVEIDNVTNGQAETVLKAASYFTNSDLLIYNIDTYFKSNTLKKLLLSPAKQDGILGAFIDNSNKWSFAKLGENNCVIETAEKIVISENALTGMYHFTNPNDFIEVATNALDNKITSLNEYYIAPMYNKLIAQGKNFVLDMVDEFIALGTPEDVKKMIDKKW